jgi:CubicO group peptidase (beta-lactamase class C family)
MHLRALAGIIIAAALPVCAQEAFPPAAPESVGLSSAALKDLSASVKALIDQDQAPGAELLVIKDGRTVLHEAFGFKDVEDHTPMALDTLFCIRSMTKTVVGTAMQMLIDEGKVSLDDRVSRFMPSFDNDKSREITVGQLLAHTSGLPLSQFIQGHALTDFDSVRGVADDAGKTGPDFPPGTGFSYSDEGADTVTALIEVVSGRPIDRLLAERVFGPLGMSDALCVMSAGEPRRARTASNYVGAPGAWSRYWDPSQPPIFSYFLGSQALYDTPADYARLLSLWMRGGKAGSRRLLSEDAVARALKPANQWVGFPTGLAGAQVWYGQFWLLYVDPARPGDDRVAAFGHGGSDGTWAWAWPDRDLMVLYFTQGRGGNSGAAVEEAVQRLVFTPGAPAPVAPPPADLDRVAGCYWDDEAGMYVLVSRRPSDPHAGQPDGLQVEIPGKTVDPLRPGKDAGTWTLTIQPMVILSFDLGEAGPATAMHVGLAGGPGKTWPRLAPQADLPAPDALAALRARAHGPVEAIAPFRRSGTMEMAARGIKGTIVSTVGGADRFRTELDFGAIQQTVISSAQGAWIVTKGQPAMELSGAMRRQTALDNPLAIFGDWRAAYRDVQVIARRDGAAGESAAYIVRVVPDVGNPTAFVVDAATGLLLEARKVVLAPGVGPMGVTTTFSDYRDVGGATLAFRLESAYDSPLLGTSVIQFDQAEARAETSPGAFDAPGPQTK